MIADAHGRYAFSKDKHSGSLSLSFEQVLAKAGNSDVWAFKYDAPSPMTKSQLLAEYPGYRALKAFQTGEIYECNSSKVPFFEQTPFRPDFLLRDLIQILHPGTNWGGLRYYKKLNG
jgi:iron complex transport system substrate-binding protein